jgi:hypothetical protein
MKRHENHKILLATKSLFTEQIKGWRTSEVVWLIFSLSAIISISVALSDNVLGITAAATGMAYTILAGKG